MSSSQGYAKKAYPWLNSFHRFAVKFTPQSEEETMLSVPFGQMFTFSVSPLELFIRGSVIYLFIFVVIRILRREPGTVGIADLIMIVLIADASQNAMAGEYHSVLDGLVLILTIVFWNYLLDWLTLHFPAIERFTHPAPIPLIQNSKMHETNMRKQLVTREQLFSMLREHGIDDLSKVKAAFIEGSGQISILRLDEDKEVDENKHRD
jgi:uncharacterized membrane protein YcaP (DUF421 family)